MSYNYTDSLAGAGAEYPGAVMTPIEVKNENLDGNAGLVETGTIPASPYKIQLSQAILEQTTLTVLANALEMTAVPLGTTLTNTTAGVDLDNGIVEFHSSFAATAYSVSYTGKGSAISSHIVNKMQNEIVATQTALDAIGTPISSTGTPVVDNTILRYDGTDGTLAQESLISINDDGQLLLNATADLAKLDLCWGIDTNTGLTRNGADTVSMYAGGTAVAGWSNTGFAATNLATTTVSLYGTLTGYRLADSGWSGAITLATSDWSDRSGYLTFTSKGTNPTTYTNRVYGRTDGLLIFDKGTTAGSDLMFGQAYIGTTASNTLTIDSSRNIFAGKVSIASGAAGTATGGIYFASDTDCGFYLSGTNQVGVFVNGTQCWNWAPTYTSFPSQLLSELAYSVSAPQYSFSGDVNTGLARVAADTLGFVAGGSLLGTYTPSGAGETNSGYLATGNITIKANPDNESYPTIIFSDVGGDAGTGTLHYEGIGDFFAFDKYVQCAGLGSTSSISGTNGSFTGYVVGQKYMSDQGNNTSISIAAGLMNGGVLFSTSPASIVTWNLPTAAAGLTATFINNDTDGLKVYAAAGDYIRNASNLSAAAGYFKSTEVGASMTIVAIDATYWVVTAMTGTWTIDA
jgi:hypothetical protein